MEYNKILKGKKFTVWIFENSTRGYFEDNFVGDDHAGGLWFENGKLVDYDGVYVLPDEVEELLINEGFWVL